MTPSRAVKRSVDVAGAMAALVVASPLIAGVAISVRLRMGNPVLFAQVRPGHDCEPFRMYKFRTMTVETDESSVPTPDSERLTPLGVFLRRWSLDELPEFWNVLRGDMSLVGPRPLLLEYVDLYNAEQARRHEVRPGITGLAQINGRNDMSWEDRLSLDVWYVDHWSLWLDFRILALTVVRALAGVGVVAPGSATMPRFEGTRRG